jgi:hypothetical protein
MAAFCICITPHRAFCIRVRRALWSPEMTSSIFIYISTSSSISLTWLIALISLSDHGSFRCLAFLATQHGPPMESHVPCSKTSVRCSRSLLLIYHASPAVDRLRIYDVSPGSLQLFHHSSTISFRSTPHKNDNSHLSSLLHCHSHYLLFTTLNSPQS